MDSEMVEDQIILVLVGSCIKNVWKKLGSQLVTTVDGRNPAPPGMYKTL